MHVTVSGGDARWIPIILEFIFIFTEQNIYAYSDTLTSIGITLTKNMLLLGLVSVQITKKRIVQKVSLVCTSSSSVWQSPPQHLKETGSCWLL